MKSSELAAEVMTVVIDAQGRINGIGADQYSTVDDDGNERQKFEDMEIGDLLTYVEEETLDLVNYGVMLTIRLRRLRNAFNAIDSRRPPYPGNG